MTDSKVAIQDIAVSKLRPSPFNRHDFDEDQMKELADSIKVQGVINPILARPLDTQGLYEIVNGERRWMASKKAGKKTIPARIEILTDREAQELILIENSQRENVHPLDEAEVFAHLLKHPDATTKLVAQRVSKEESYVVRVLHYNNLLPDLKHQFRTREIGPGHANLLSRLTHADQRTAIEQNWVQPNVTYLRNMITGHLMLDLSKVKWDLEDAALLPEAGSCIACPKRTGANTLLFPDIKQQNVCTDRQCFTRKEQAFVHIQTEKAKAKDEKLVPVANLLFSGKIMHPGQCIGSDKDVPVLNENQYVALEKKNECTFAEKAIVVYGSEVGSIIWICRNEECKDHYGRPTTPSASDTYQESQRVERKKDQERKDKRRRIFRAVTEKIKDVKRDDVTHMAKFFCLRLGNDPARNLVKVLDIPHERQKGEHKRYDEILAEHAGKLKSEDELLRFLFVVSLGAYMDNEPFDKKQPDPLLQYAERLKIDIKKLDQDAKQKAKAAKA